MRHQDGTARKLAAGMRSTARRVAIWLAVSSSALCLAAEEPDYALLRKRLIREIGEDARAMSRHLGSELGPRVLDVLASVPRHEFVPERLRRYAYDNRPLPIGHGQTISQPYIVALMTDLLQVDGGDVVLEVGTGSGYQAAVLSPLVERVYSIEIIPELAEQATGRLKRLGYANVEVKSGDGYYGWEAHAPFDAIIVTAAASHVPPPLVQQLEPGGRLVIPVGGRFMTQQLTIVTKSEQGGVRTRQVLPVVFVPLTGGH